MSASTSFAARGLTIPRIAVVFFLLVALFLLRDTWLPQVSTLRPGTSVTSSTNTATPQSPPSPASTPTRNSAADFKETGKGNVVGSGMESCRHVPGADRVMVMLKTGATEIYEKLPIHLVTLSRCVPNFRIFSDLAQTFADVQVHDAIAPVSKHIREKHEDFELYRLLEKYQREGQDMGQLKGHNSWNLDKWKFLPMLHQAFEAADDNIDWFVMMEADTSVSWTNLLQWLKTMDPKKPLYLGAQNNIGETTFAHGGSGVVISRRAADMLQAVRRKEGNASYDEKWERVTGNSCCGDEVIARAFLEADVTMTPAWPLIQGETVSSIDYLDKHWCSPAITWHHMKPIELDAMWQFQSDWVNDHGWSTPYLFRDVFAHFIDRHITVNRTSWNNISKDKKYVAANLPRPDDDTVDFALLKDYEKKAVESQELCAQACGRWDECVQWMFSPGRCYLGKDIRFGKNDDKADEHWTSGWMQDRIRKWREEREGCKIRWTG